MISYIKKDLTKLFNIGDSLCTPDVYFDISSEKDLRIIGGGVWNIKKYGTDSNASRTVLWAAGESIKDSKTTTIDSTQLKYLEWSSRDADLLKNKNRFVPCVSCFHNEILAPTNGSNTLIFTNANNVVSDRIGIDESNETQLLTNSAAYSDFIQKWESSDRVITNSYHGIYWSLLSGREVSPFGYSSKFVSLLKLFDLEFPQDQLYRLRDKTSLTKRLSSPSKKFFRLKNPEHYVSLFQEKNMNFVEKLRTHGIGCKKKQ